MPIYDFKCVTCNKVEEVKDNAPYPCTTCGNTMQRVWNTAAFKPSPGMYSYKG